MKRIFLLTVFSAFSLFILSQKVFIKGNVVDFSSNIGGARILNFDDFDENGTYMADGTIVYNGPNIVLPAKQTWPYSYTDITIMLPNVYKISSLRIEGTNLNINYYGGLSLNSMEPIGDEEHYINNGGTFDEYAATDWNNYTGNYLFQYIKVNIYNPFNVVATINKILIYTEIPGTISQTGIYSSPLNTDLNLYTGIDKRLTISNTTGNVGIGAAPTATERLFVNGNVKANSFIGDGSKLTAVGSNYSNVIDTRNVNTPPTGYSQNAKFEFKNISTIEAPGNGTYGGLLTIAPWVPDGTGGNNHQLFFNNGGLFYRTGVSNSSSWNSWNQIWHSGNLNKADVDFTAKKITAGSYFLSDGSPLSNGTSQWTTSGSNIKYSGNVGIGIFVNSTNPGEKLDVNGNLRSSGKIYSTSELSGSDQTYLRSWGLTGDGNIWIHPYAGHNLYLSDDGSGTGTLDINFGNTIFENGNVVVNYNVLIGKTTQVNNFYKLDVAGSVRANEVVVNTDGSDFVFENNYKLRSLNDLEKFVKENKHLPEIAPAKDMQENGMSVSEMQTKLLQKVEELTLYMIDLKKENEQLKTEIEKLKNK